MTKAKLFSLILPAFGAALIAVLSQIVIPVGTVPFTLQTLGVGLISTLFKPREAILSVGLYLLLGAVGLPVFAGGAAGLVTLFGPTAGFLWGFLLYALITSVTVSAKSSLLKIFAFNFLGDSTAFICGLFSLHFWGQMTWQAAFLAGALPFILPDLGKMLAITVISKPLFTSLKSSAYFQKQ